MLNSPVINLVIFHRRLFNISRFAVHCLKLFQSNQLVFAIINDKYCSRFNGGRRVRLYQTQGSGSIGFLASFHSTLLLMKSDSSALIFLDKLNISKSSLSSSNIDRRKNLINLRRVFSVSTFEHLSYERGDKLTDDLCCFVLLYNVIVSFSPVE